MDVMALPPRLHLLRFPVGQAYLWSDSDTATLVDAGTIADALTALGRAPPSVRRIVLTHFHEDHTGGAGEFAAPRVAGLDAEVACLGHGDPVTARASAVLREAADRHGVRR
ncbi:hypothetical protein CTZ28_26315 [Streptomyces shenzhenensis]|uniref:Metallo-beta-lactamase domain-containing protein n=1 Tax=Streptomyces shenzhenensis TaxID=943815 RepID=A0A3M0I0J6_9ACTN|nr:hypothetical protein CTZ28_26315 [Streptomyces shenzhenensis]